MTEIQTARLRLRQLSLDDSVAYYETLLSDPDVQRFLPDGLPLPRERTGPVLRHWIDYWDEHGMGAFAIVSAADGTLIGQCGLQYLPGTRDIELFYALGKAYWSQGFAPEAARACLRFGFETLDLACIYAVFVPENKASERVMIKIGMTYQGERRAYDTVLPCYAITRDSFRPGDAPYTLFR